MESVCFSALDSFELLKPRLGQLKRFRLLGGASQSDFWMEMMCDILGTTVELPEQTEAATMGVALIASVGAGFYSSLTDAVQACVTVRKRFQPNQENRNKYLTSYRLYRDSMEKLYKGAL